MNNKVLTTGTALAAAGLAVSVFWPSSEPAFRTLTFENTNNQPVCATILSKTNLAQLEWKAETNFVAGVGLNEWCDYDTLQAAKFYTVQFIWYY